MGVAKKDFQFVLGTEGNPDYVIVAQNGAACLGVKPLLSFSSKGTMVGLRVRSCSAPNTHEKADGTTDFPKKMPFDEAWPDMPFDKVDESRASTMLMMTIPALPNTPDQLSAVIGKAKFYAKMDDLFGKYVNPDHVILSSEDLRGWLSEQYVHLMDESGPPDNLKDKAAEAAEAVEALEKGPTGGEVIDFNDYAKSAMTKKNAEGKADTEPQSEDDPDAQP